MAIESVSIYSTANGVAIPKTVPCTMNNDSVKNATITPHLTSIELGKEYTLTATPNKGYQITEAPTFIGYDDADNELFNVTAEKQSDGTWTGKFTVTE